MFTNNTYEPSIKNGTKRRPSAVSMVVVLGIGSEPAPAPETRLPFVDAIQSAGGLLKRVTISSPIETYSEEEINVDNYVFLTRDG